MDVFDRLNEDLDRIADGDQEAHAFYFFEPWDVEKRPEEIIAKALEDGIDLRDPDFIRYVGQDPHQFQSGYMLSINKLRIMLGGSQIGKSFAPKIETAIMTTGEIPFSLRYDLGVDTKIKRKTTKENILRFGRFDSSSGEFIDFNWKSPESKGWKEWDCGNIIGVGVYPQEKIAPPGSQIWIGTFKEAKVNYWWPSVAENLYKEFPESFYDRTRGNKGTNKQDGIVYADRDCLVKFITYEQGHDRFEAKMAWSYIGDEEMPNSDIWHSAQEHAKFRSIVMTPLNGITWSKKLIFPKNRNKDIQVFHATQYDSPYQDKEDIEIKRKGMESWYRGSRCWGFFTEIKGEPFYDRKKILKWIASYSRVYEWKKFQPSKTYHEMISKPHITHLPGLMDTPVNSVLCSQTNKMNTWRVYEDPIPGVGYVLTIDPSEGAETPEAVGDICAATMSRPPMKEKEEIKPVMVATIRSTLETIQFARVCSYGLRHYNNALLAPEHGRGSANATLKLELDEYPYWYFLTTTQDSTGKQREKKGFDVNSATRDIIFELVRDWLDDFEEDEYPYIPDEPLLKELAAAVLSVKGEKKRCDHTSEGTLDSAITFGIMCYIYKFDANQIRCNVEYTAKKKAISRFKKQPLQQKAPCGMSSIGYRNGGT